MAASQMEREKVAPLEERPQRLHRQPWWTNPTLLGDGLYDTPTGEPLSAFEMSTDRYPDGSWVETYDHELSPYEIGPARRRYLPEDTYLHPAEVMATLTAALHWDKGINVSFMRMGFDPFRGVQVPIQHHHTQCAIGFIEPDRALFGVISTDSEQVEHIAMDLVTDITLVDLCEVCQRITKHRQNDGSIVQVTWGINPQDVGDGDWIQLKNRPYVLDDGTEVPVFVNERDESWTPAVTLAPEEDPTERFDTEDPVDLENLVQRAKALADREGAALSRTLDWIAEAEQELRDIRSRAGLPDGLQVDG